MLFPLARMGVGQRASFDPFDRFPGTRPGTSRTGRGWG
jgi:hypothetical protein